MRLRIIILGNFPPQEEFVIHFGISLNDITGIIPLYSLFSAKIQSLEN